MIMFTKQIETQTKRTNRWTPREKSGAGVNLEIGIDLYTLSILCIK